MARDIGKVRVGISGWRYAPWRKVFYPAGLLQRKELAYASRMLPTIEINGSFYSLQKPSSYQAWFDETPDDFVFAVKGPRYITHMRRLKDVRAPLANFLASGVLALGTKLGPILWQFPPQMSFDPDRFDAFFRLLPHDTASALTLAQAHDERLAGRSWLEKTPSRALRHAVEIRHPSFADAAFVAMLRRHRVALVVADTAGRWPLLEDMTADFVYVRLHGDKELYASGYGDAALDAWARRIDSWRRGGQVPDARLASSRSDRAIRRRDVFCYFDNDVKVHAPYDAARLASRLGVETGLDANGTFATSTEFAQITSSLVDRS
ncbi:MAG: DUF72 domain-containing protein [Pseudomonadota bacterium]|nr:DUF72 domain-containing protein [Pseudomonadota bacterium]